MRLLAYRTSSADDFLDASRSIAATVGDLLDGGIEHIGSTAIPGMIAKPQIDMLAPVRDLADAAHRPTVANRRRRDSCVAGRSEYATAAVAAAHSRVGTFMRYKGTEPNTAPN